MRKLFVLVGLLAWVGAIVCMPRKPAVEAPAEAAAKGQTHAVRPLTSHERPVAAEERAAPGDAGHLELACMEIDAAVVTYSPAGVKAIRPFLLDGDAGVRRAARDGMVQLGEGDAIPLLRAAAGKLTDPEEIASFQEAADLLALPAWSDTEEAGTVIAEMIDENER